MKALAAFWNAIVTAVKAYPNGVAILVNAGVILGARFGFNLTATEIVALAIAVHAGMSAFAHTATVPKSMLKGQ